MHELVAVKHKEHPLLGRVEPKQQGVAAEPLDHLVGGARVDRGEDAVDGFGQVVLDGGPGPGCDAEPAVADLGAEPGGALDEVSPGEPALVVREHDGPHNGGGDDDRGRVAQIHHVVGQCLGHGFRRRRDRLWACSPVEPPSGAAGPGGDQGGQPGGQVAGKPVFLAQSFSDVHHQGWGRHPRPDGRAGAGADRGRVRARARGRGLGAPGGCYCRSADKLDAGCFWLGGIDGGRGDPFKVQRVGRGGAAREAGDVEGRGANAAEPKHALATGHVLSVGDKLAEREGFGHPDVDRAEGKGSAEDP